MSKVKLIVSILKEYGVAWAFNRAAYSLKLKMLSIAPFTEALFEKKTDFPSRLNIFDIKITELRKFISELPESDKNSLIKNADGICSGKITGFSSTELDYGSPIDWQLNPLTGLRCDNKAKWYKIADFDPERGDIKVIWEASRFSHFITLARAYLLTRNEKYSNAFSGQLSEWLKSNPYGYGANFKCGQECALRMINALLAYAVFTGSGILSEEDEKNMLDLVYRCYKKILSNFFYAYKCIKNNHTVSELTGIIVGAWCCRDQKRLQKAYKLLNKVIDEQFTGDGGYLQFSFNYQRLALQDLEIVLSVSEKTGIALSEKSIDKIKKAAELMYQCQDECGDMPNYGNNDGALAFPVTGCGYRDFRPVINTVHSLTAGFRLFEKGTYDEELVWFSGGKGIADFEIKAVERRSSSFPEAGLFTLRNNKAWVMIVLNDYKSRPAHMDQLHIDLWIDGVNVLCDAGTYSYASKEGARLIKNDMHNTAFVDSKYQMNSFGRFMIYDRTKRIIGHIGDDCFEGTSISANGYKHTRSVKLTETSVELVDCVDADYEIAFHTACGISREDGNVSLIGEGKELCSIESESNESFQKEIRSLYYLKQDDTTAIKYKGFAGNKTYITIKFKENKK